MFSIVQPVRPGPQTGLGATESVKLLDTVQAGARLELHVYFRGAGPRSRGVLVAAERNGVEGVLWEPVFSGRIYVSFTLERELSREP